MERPTCLFCGGDRSEPNHLAHCDGRQGPIEEAIARADADPDLDVPAFEPLLVAGIEPATWDTSEAAAVSVESAKDTQRAAVFHAIKAAGADGRTDDELQVLLGLDGSSERPRRWELYQLGLIKVQQTEAGPVRRPTRTRRNAVVWVVAGRAQEGTTMRQDTP